MMIDHNESLERIAKALGSRYREAPYVVNVPGSSVACKVDAYYYLAVQPMCVRNLAKWAGMLESRVVQTLLRTGNLVTGPDRVKHYLRVKVLEEGARQGRPIGAGFLLATFVDHALAMYGGVKGPLPLSGLRISPDERASLEAFFAGRTPLQNLAFAPA